MNYNYEAIEKVLNHIERHPEQFDMQCYYRTDAECGTVACLAGWACILLDKNFDTAEKHPIYYIETASQIFGFCKNDRPIFYTFNEPDEVIDVLKKAVAQKNFFMRDRETLTEISEGLQYDIFSWSPDDDEEEY